MVRDAFRQRASGEPFAEIGRAHGWSHSTARQMLANEAYLGIIRSGEYVNEDAHPAIVSREQIEAANVARRKRPVAAGTLKRDRLLLGIARCAGCGKTLKVLHRPPRRDGSWVAYYYCKDGMNGAVSERAYVHADDLEDCVEGWFVEALGDRPEDDRRGRSRARAGTGAG